MTDFKVMAEINKYIPLLPPTSILDTLKYKHSGLDDWNSSDDINAENRENTVSALYKVYSQEHKAIIRFLTIAEIQYCREETMMTGVLRQLLFMLYDLADLEDVPLIFEAKFGTSFDSRCSIDIELLFGKNTQKIKDYYQINKHPIYDIVQFFNEYENEELVSPSEYIEKMRKWYID